MVAMAVWAAAKRRDSHWSDRPRKVRVGDHRACMHARQDQQAMPPVSVSGVVCEGARAEGHGDAQWHTLQSGPPFAVR